MKSIKLIISILFSICFFGSSFASDNVMPEKVTDWMKNNEFKTIHYEMTENRFMPYKISGKYENGGIFYKGTYVPHPPNLEYYYAFWGMNNKWYKKRKSKLEPQGFKEVWHQSYLDVIGSEIHQVIWLKLDMSEPEKDVPPKKTIHTL